MSISYGVVRDDLSVKDTFFVGCFPLFHLHAYIDDRAMEHDVRATHTWTPLNQLCLEAIE